MQEVELFLCKCDIENKELILIAMFLSHLCRCSHKQAETFKLFAPNGAVNSTYAGFPERFCSHHQVSL